MNDETNPQEAEVVKRPRGRPRKAAPPPESMPTPAAPKAQVARYQMTAKPNWEDLDDLPQEDNPDRLRIDKSLLPPEFDFQWVTVTVYGQPQPQRRQQFERRGWTPVHQKDFNGQFNGMFMPKNAPGEIIVDGLVLMYRPIEMTLQARKKDRARANEQVQIKERALRGGDIPGVTLDASHPNAVNSNRINKSYERITIPED